MDKDTWIAENLIPKNTEQDRKPRLNVKSVDVFTATRKTKFTLCILGSWAIYMPPYNIARLCSLTREAGYATNVFDFNVESHYALKEANPDLADAWNGANYFWWQDPEYYTRIHPTYEPILKEYLETLLATDTDIFGFSTYYTNVLPTRWMITEIRKRRPDATIVMGGPECHESYFKMPENIDYYFIGESEQNILDFLNNWEQGIKPEKPAIGSLYSDTRIDIDSLPYPDYSDFDLSRYWGKNSICAEISRGCIAKCSYCTEVYYWKFRDRGALTVVDELEYQVKKYGISFVSFVDSLMNGNLKEFRKFCDELIKRKLGFSWWGYARADGRMDLDFYQAMADAGCQGFNYGIESGSDKVLKAVNKKNTVAEINQNLIDSEKVGMKVSACWVIGAPGEDIEAFAHSFNMLWNHRTRIMAVSPGPGLGDNYGSAYDDREKFNINPRGKPWLGGWYSLDFTNTRLHRHIRIKLMHMWLYICREYNGTLTNVHKIGNITDHFNVVFDSEYINETVEYEDFNFNIINSGQGAFADSVMNEMFSLLRMLWRVRGGYEITIKFNKDLDHQDFIFAISPDTHSYDADIWFKIDDDGNFQTNCKFNFVNTYRNVVPLEKFDYEYISTGQWKEAKKTQLKKTFFIKQEVISPINLPLESCFSSVSVPERTLLAKVARALPKESIVVDVGSRLGGKAAIISHTNKDVYVHCIESFSEISLQEEFNGMTSWVRNQLSDICSNTGIEQTQADNLYNGIVEDFSKDSTGELVWNRITGKKENVFLYKFKSPEEIQGLDLPIDLCTISFHENPKLKNNIDFWKSRIKTGGYLVAHPYSETLAKDVYDEFTVLINEGWKIADRAEMMLILQKP